MSLVLAALAIAWLPGAVTWYLLSRSLSQISPATVDRRPSEIRFLMERGDRSGDRSPRFSGPLWTSLFLCTATGLMIVGWLGLALAQLGRFTPTTISAALVTYTTVCLGLLAWRYPTCSRWTLVQREQVNGGRSSSGVEPSGGTVGRLKRFWSRGHREGIVAAVLFAGALYLYSLPAEYLPAFFDPGWYLNTGALVAETGALTFESQPFSTLPPDLRPLFFSSFSALRFDFPQLPESRSRGFFLTAFAVPDADDGAIRPYHPPLLSIWLALFYTLGGVRAALHVPILFGALSVLAMFLAGRALFGRGPGLLAAVLLALSLPQVYFSRTSYAEILLQFFVLIGLYELTTFARGMGSIHAALAGLALGQALLTKIESVLIVIPLAVFWAAWLARRRGGFRALAVFGVPFAALAGHALLLAVTVNRFYVALNGYGVWSRLRIALARPLLWLALAVGVVVAASWLFSHRRSWRGVSAGHWLIQAPSPAVRRAMAWVILLLAAYGYFVQPLVSSIMAGGLTASEPPSLVQLGRFLSPWGLWLGVVGLVLLLDRGFVWRHLFFAALVLTTCAIVVAAPTISTGVSPLYTIRRQVPVVIPVFVLLASYALLGDWRPATDFLRRSPRIARNHSATDVASLRQRYRLSLVPFVQGLAILVLVAGLVQIARPYLRYREMRGTVAFVEHLADQFPPETLALFEAVSVDSHVGRFAAPLWAMHGIDTLVLSSRAVPEEMDQALAHWASRYRAMYWVSTSPHPPVMVSGYRFDLVGDELWESSAIAPDPRYPPQIEYLEVPFYIYRIMPQSP